MRRYAGRTYQLLQGAGVGVRRRVLVQGMRHAAHRSRRIAACSCGRHRTPNDIRSVDAEEGCNSAYLAETLALPTFDEGQRLLVCFRGRCGFAVRGEGCIGEILGCGLRSRRETWLENGRWWVGVRSHEGGA